MQINEKGKKILVCIFYVLSLLPLFLPWCYFEEEVDGIKSGLDIVNHELIYVRKKGLSAIHQTRRNPFY